MRNVSGDNVRAGERGAISIKALLTMVLVVSALFILIKIGPVYIEQRKVTHDLDELARIAAVRGWKEDKISQDANRIRGEYELPEGCINVTAHDRKVQIVLGYTRAIDLLVTTYNWQVAYTAIGKE